MPRGTAGFPFRRIWWAALAAAVTPFGCTQSAPPIACFADGGCPSSAYICDAERICVLAGSSSSGATTTSGGASGTGGGSSSSGSGSTVAGSSSAGASTGTGGQACLPTGADCAVAGFQPCCSGSCVAVGDGGLACAALRFCSPAGAACQTPNDCCSESCQQGQCASAPCATVDAGCSGPSDCCSDTCSNGFCQPVSGSGSCATLGNACSSGSDCCSTNCQGKICVRAYTCNAIGDICFGGSDCCSALCSAADGGPGTCQTVSASGAGGCTVDGQPCSSGTNCCSRLCLDPGSGADVCAPASGCKLTGDVCTQDGDCCGGPPFDSQVTCSLFSQDPPIGLCSKPNGSGGNTGCEPVGDICGANGSNARQDCCDGNKAVCKLDSEGISRCFGGGPGSPDGGCAATGYAFDDPSCCIAAGQGCEFRDQCCGQAPCLPVADGGFVCATPLTCLTAGALCFADGGSCCEGLVCAPALEIGNACQVPASIPDGGTDGGEGGDGGASDAGPTCLPDQSVCTLSNQCCSGYCFGGTCGAGPSCEPQSSPCTSTADCCLGLYCSVPVGSASGTCEPGSSCSQIGQVCAQTGDCCFGLACQTSSGAACGLGQSCTCTVVIQ